MKAWKLLALCLATSLALGGTYKPIFYESQGNAHNLETTTAIDHPGWPWVGAWPQQYNLVNLWGTLDANEEAVLTAMADSTDYWMVDMSRVFSTNGDAQIDDFQARGDAAITHYLRFDHAASTPDSSANDATVDSGAGAILFRAETIGRQYPVYNTDSPREHVKTWLGSPDAYLWNFWRGREPWEPAFDLTLNVAYLDTTARQLSRFPTIPVDMMFVDYMAAETNVYNGAALGGAVDYDDDDVAEYSSYTWSNATMQQAFYDWQYNYALNLNERFPWTKLIANGNWSDWGNRTDPDFLRLASVFDGFTYECMGLTSTQITTAFDDQDENDPLASIRSSSLLYDTYGKKWNTFSFTCAVASYGTNASQVESHRANTVMSLLGAAGMLYRGDVVDSADEILRMIRQVDAFGNAGIPIGELKETSIASGDSVLLSRAYTGGVASGRFSATSGLPGGNATGGYHLYWRPGTFVFEAETETPDEEEDLTVSISASRLGDLTFNPDATVSGGTSPYTYFWSSSNIGAQSGVPGFFPTSSDADPSIYNEAPVATGSRAALLTLNVLDSATPVANLANDTLSVWIIDPAPAQIDTTITPSFTVSNASGDSLNYQFDSTTTFDPAGTEAASELRWQVLLDTGGITGSYTDSVAAHTFTRGEADSALVTLLVVTDRQAEASGRGADFAEFFNSASQWVPIARTLPPANVAPTSDFSYTSSDSLFYQFFEEATDSDGTVVQWDWNFGDGTTSISANPTKTYAQTGGTRTVTLVVTDDDGDTDSSQQVIPIAAPVATGIPQVTGVVGTKTSGEAVTINGLDFSTKDSGPPKWWDDFEDGAVGTYLKDVNASYLPSVLFNPGQGNGLAYTDDFAVSGSLSVYNPDYNGGTDGTSGQTSYITFTQSDIVFVSWKLRYSADTSGGQAITKDLRVLTWPPGQTGPYGTGNNGTLVLANGNPNAFPGRGPEPAMFTHYATGSETLDRYTGWRWDTEGDEWVSWAFASELGTAFGSNTYIFVEGLGATSSDRVEKSDYDAVDGTDWGFSSVMLGAASTSNSGNPFFSYLDDLYVDTTFARVEIRDSSIYANATKCDMFIPETWATGQITGTWHSPSFSTSETAYVFVVDRFNTPSAGFAVTID